MIPGIVGDIEAILQGTPDEVRALYERDMEVLKSGTPEQKRIVAKRHALQVLPIDAKTAVDRAALKTLEYQIKEGKADSIALEDLKDISEAPTFSAIGQGGGTNVFDRGFVVMSYKMLGQGKVLRTFYSFFKDDNRRKRAVQGQEFVASLREYMRKNVTDVELARLLDKLEPIKPAYSKRNIVANVFIDAKDMHEELKTADPSGDFRAKYEAAYNSTPQLGAGNSYDILNMIVEGYERAGTGLAKPGNDEVVNALLGINGFKGALGLLSIGSDHIVWSPAVVKVIKNGKPVTLG